MTIANILDDFLELQERYAVVFRASFTKERCDRFEKNNKISIDNYSDPALHEPLIEHVGHLPIIASYFHSQLDKPDQVDLGHVLMILAIHDIGETVTGDVLTYKKTTKHQEYETKVLKNLLSKEQLELHEELEKRETLEAKYAKAVDAICPILHELTIPKILPLKFKAYGFNIDDIVAKKTKYFSWDKMLQSLFEESISRYKKAIDRF